MDWLIDETTTPTKHELEAEVVQAPHLRGKSSAALAIRLNDVVVHDVRKWFFGADIRLDAIVIDGGGNKDQNEPFYQPSTARFPGVKDGDRLPIYEPGLLVFWGRPRHFLDVSIMVSRDRKDSEDLAVLLGEVAHSDDWRDLSATIGALRSRSTSGGRRPRRYPERGRARNGSHETPEQHHGIDGRALSHALPATKGPLRPRSSSG